VNGSTSPEARATSAATMLTRLCTGISVLACAVVYAAHLQMIRYYAVDVPWWDEWDEMPRASLEWIFRQHSEHRIVTSKLLICILYLVDGWNLATHQTVNFVLYGVLLAVLTRLCLRAAPGLAAWVVLAFIPFLLSPINYENHNWGLQSNVHLALLFFFASLLFLYDEAQRWSRLIAGGALAVLAMYSSASGLVASMVGLAVYAAFKIGRAWSAADRGLRAREARQVLAVGLLMSTACGLWFVGYWGARGHMLPSAQRFSLYFLDVLGSGFALDPDRPALDALCLLAVVAPIVIELGRTRGRADAPTWSLSAAVAGILAWLAAIAVGRAPLGLLRANRYAEVAMTLIPMAIAAWALVLRHRRWGRGLALAAAWLCCFQTFRDDWSGAPHYEEAARQRRRGLRCIANYYAGFGSPDCPTLYPRPLRGYLEFAHAGDLSFTRAALIPPPRVVLRPVTLENAEGYYRIDAVNGRPGATLPPVLEVARSEALSIGGWAVDPLAGDEPADVFVVIDGTTEVRAAYGIRRPDVAQAFRNPRYGYAGFQATIREDSLSRGRHVLRLKIVGASGAYWEPAWVTRIRVH